MMMKKVYMSPVIDVVECVPAAMVATSPLQVETDKQYNDNDGSFDGEAAGASRGSWGNIWK